MSPYRAGHACGYPSCPGIARPGKKYCSKHSGMERKPDDRPSAGVRGYDAAWQKFRIWYLRRHPICVIAGCGCVAMVVDHIKALNDGGDKYDEANLQAMCAFHHNQKTARENKAFGNIPRGRG